MIAILAPVKWFYEKRGTRHGPIEEGQFARMVNAGIISPTTLVRHSDLSGWVPFAELDRTGSAAALLPVLEPEPDPAPLAPPAAPSVPSAPSEPVALTEKPPAANVTHYDAWRAGRVVVVPRHEGLPHRCVKCNAVERLSRETVRLSPTRPTAVGLIWT